MVKPINISHPLLSAINAALPPERIIILGTYFIDFTYGDMVRLKTNITSSITKTKAGKREQKLALDNITGR